MPAAACHRIRSAPLIRNAGSAAVIIMIAFASLPVAAADPNASPAGSPGHRLIDDHMPPGAVGQIRAAGLGPFAGYFQPVEISGPEGTEFALAQNGVFVEPSSSLLAGLLIGPVYRFRITGIPRLPGTELYPTVEVIDRTYPPPNLALQYPIQVRLDEEDFDAALEGKLVMRVIYLEDPQTATPIEQTTVTDRPTEIAQYQDALEVADRLGRPVAIVRIGSVAPPRAPALLPSFFFGSPPWAPIVATADGTQQDSPQATASPENRSSASRRAPHRAAPGTIRAAASPTRIAQP